MVKRRRNSIRSLVGYARTGYKVGRAVKGAYNAYRSMTRTSNKKRAIEIAPLTSQRDFRVTYSKRRMPRRKKRAYVRSVKRFRSMNMKSLPSRIHQCVNVTEYVSGLNQSRYFGAFMGLTAQNTYDTSLQNVLENIAPGTGAQKLRSGGIRLDHQSLRCVIRNASDAGETIDLDVYKVICIKDIPYDAWTNGLGIEHMHASLKNNMRQHQGMDIEAGSAVIPPVQQNAGTNASNQVVGDLLWNNPPFLRYWKIVKQFKIQLPPGNTTEFSMRSSRNKFVKYAECFDETQGAIMGKAYLTQGYIFNINGRARIIDNVVSFDDVKVVVEQYVRYNCKVVEGSAPTLVHDPA